VGHVSAVHVAQHLLDPRLAPELVRAGRRVLLVVPDQDRVLGEELQHRVGVAPLRGIAVRLEGALGSR
jgi:hypothetical protein